MKLQRWFAEYLTALMDVVFPKKKHSALAQRQGPTIISPAHTADPK